MSYHNFVWRNGMRNKRRTILTMLSVALALFVLSTLVGALSQIERNLEEANPLRLVVRHAVSFTESLPERYRAQIEKVPGVVAVTPLNWFGGIYIDEAHTDFAQFACDPLTVFDVFPELKIPPEQKQSFIQERRAAVVARRVAEKHGWKLGDQITLKGAIYPVNLELTIRGIFTGSAAIGESVLFFHRAYLDELPGGWRGQVEVYEVWVDSAQSVSRVIETIDAMFQNTDAPTKTETERTFQMNFISMLGNLNRLIVTISGVIIFTLLLVTANTMAMSVRERIREIAVLKTLGFRPHQVIGLLVSEGVLITLTGGLIGSLGARLLFSSLNLAVFTQGFIGQLNIAWGIIALSLTASVLVGLVSTGIPAYRAAKLTVAEGLRHVG